MQDFTAATYREQADEAKRRLDIAKETWRQCHDRDVDHTYALMSLVKEQLGEPAIRRMYDRVLLPLFVWRYEKFDIDKHPWDDALETLMLVACEAMRGHLVGPERTGDFELIETEDRFILRFDPCGSGQRTIRGDWVENTPARMEPPYNWTVTTEPASWNHYEPGVCLYCVHCIVLMEEMPIDRFGYPVRVVDPPALPGHEPRPVRCARSASGRCSRTRPPCPRSTTRGSGARSRRRSAARPRGPRSCPSSTWACPGPAEASRRRPLMTATHLPVVQPSDAVGKRVRTGPWADQAVSTYRKIAEALEGAGDDPASGGGERERAAQLIDYFMEEAKVIYLAVDTLVPRLLEWSAGAGATTDEVEAELARLRGLLRYPDGSPYEPVEGWKRLGARAGALSAQVRGADLTVAEATAELEGLRHQWQLLHDRHLDFLGGVVGFVGRRFGEEAIGESWRYVLEPFVRERYFVFDTRRQPYEESLERNLYIAFESMRGHLVGPARTGDIELEEHDDRYVLRFDPCSSGGRFLRGDPRTARPRASCRPTATG